MTNLISALQTAHEQDHEATVALINLVRAFACVHREGRRNSDLIEELVQAEESQRETEQRYRLAEAALAAYEDAEARVSACACGEPGSGDPKSTHSPAYCKILDVDARSFDEVIIPDARSARERF